MITNTAILNSAYFNRGLMPHAAATPNLVRETDGTLWAAIRGHHQKGTVELYRSGDYGFSWENVFRGDFPTGVGWGFENTTATGRFHGAFVSLNVFENIDRLIIWLAFERGGDEGEPPQVWPWIFTLSTGEEVTGSPYAPPAEYTGYEVAADDLNIKVVYNQNRVYICYLKDLAIRVRTFNPHQVTNERSDTGSGNSWLDHDETARDDEFVDFALVNDQEDVFYQRYSDSDLSFNSPELIAQGNNIKDLNIERNGIGELLIAWSDGGHPRVALSKDNGVNWNVEEISTPDDPFVDQIESEVAGRVHVQAGLDSFLMTVTSSTSNRDRTYVAEVKKGSVQEFKLIATESHPDQNITGAKFFATSDHKLVDLSDPGMSRVAFQVGHGDVSNTTPVRFAQETLDESAFAPSEEDPIVTNPGDGQVKVNMNVLDAGRNIDYYEHGATGIFTKKNQAALRKSGTQVRLKRYDPTWNAETDDRSAYGAPEEFVTEADIQSLTYDQPFAATQDSFKTFVERDVRQITLPPDFHLTRNVILNAGNFLKRTVWIAEWGGNEYEVTQVIPQFVKNQITSYKANMYVIGPSRDPFSRVVLPSET